MVGKKGGKLVYVLLFVFSFFFFLYLTFPYGVLKEAMIAEISKNTGLSLRIKDFGPDLPVGFEAEGVVISKGGNEQVDLRNVEVSISLLSLLIGQITADVELTSRNRGTLEASASWGLIQLAFNQNAIPSSIEVEANDFDVGQVASFGLELYSKSANDLIKGTLEKMKIAGSLTGNIEADLAVDDPLQSSGFVDLKLLKTTLDLNDPNLGLAKQIFKKAIIKADLKGGNLNVAPVSGFHSQELLVDIKGSAKLKNPVPSSLLNIGIDVKLKGGLKDNFEFILGMMGGSEGSAKYKLSGTFGRPNFRTQ